MPHFYEFLPMFLTKHSGERRNRGEIMDTVFTFTDILPFNLEIVSDGGQAFRWNPEPTGGYTGVVGKLVLKAVQESDTLRVTTNAGPADAGIIEDYFDLERDYAAIENKLRQYEELQPAVNFCSGNRILHQDPWETTVSFIISANNSIRNIKKTIERICEYYGEPVEYNGKLYHSFPSPETLANVSEEELRKTKCGFRARYIIETARLVAGGEIDLYGLQKIPTPEARRKLQRLPGVGRKVADCILLFSMRKFDAFPIDVWIKRVLEKLYFNGRSMPIRKLQEFAEDRFKNLAGFAQQYLFHYTRTFWNEMKEDNVL
ncbi:DNA-3-methyladenine glycosylase family protein [Thermoanaerobacterium sp. DL9XJH110]|uniref:DNA-3-methyladenine glycosylase family protein n=1 Tax=Thermoanaerobacterium sp. DL9XJH110 TaxID=3386643 RepID=UPI003BB55E29